MVENDHREALTDGDRAAAFQQLAFEGLSVTAIARRTGTKQRVVKTALAVTENPVTATAIQEHQLTLDQAAVLIEFDGEDDIRADLIQVATTDPAQFAHAAQRARDEKARVATKANAEAEVAGSGYTVLENDPGYYDIDYTRISELLTADDQRGTVEDIANAIVVGACESVTSKQTWRVPSPTDTAYFTQLAAWGYSLSDVEQIVIGEQQPTDSPAADNDATVNVEEQ